MFKEYWIFVYFCNECNLELSATFWEKEGRKNFDWAPYNLSVITHNEKHHPDKDSGHIQFQATLINLSSI